MATVLFKYWWIINLFTFRIYITYSQWIIIGTEPVGDQGIDDKFRFLDFNTEIYANYPVSQIDQYKIEWDFNTGSYSNQIIFQLSSSNPSYEIFKDSVPNNEQQDINIDIISSTIPSIIPITNNQLFCKACASASSIKYGDSCWAILPSTDDNRGCGCSSGGWTGTGIYYGGWRPSQCSAQVSGCQCWGGGFAGELTDGQKKGGISSGHIQLIYILIVFPLC